MEALKGVERGSYIWGRSVHNIQIERLWRDATLGFGQNHIWLLHHLFSDALNADALAWAEAWNTHVLSVRGERQQSPKDMFVFGMMDNGMHGLGDGDAEEIAEFGIDWSDIDDTVIHAHHNSNNPTDELGENPFLTHQPQYLSHVPVEQPQCPFASDDQVAELDHQIQQFTCYGSQDMAARHLLWISILNICVNMFPVVFH
ncbi:hypothetical protein BDN71DRAFT_1485246 [Pleurotus eryngii]|uniref:Integrase core domain-containing protein n=1 Tax=Pleurotus eryngii TaxID=5323 RepID=A0A9P5ZI22_PLEER|nr:hypothetical protein BDN71DRAFT_1485246 [Pleurotus eryngii]